jgi:hypothetical protein
VAKLFRPASTRLARATPVFAIVGGTLDTVTAERDGLDPGPLWSAHRRLGDACGELALGAFNLDDRQVFRAMAWKLPATGGIAATYAMWNAIADAAIEFEFDHQICQRVDRLAPDELLGEEQRSAAKVAGYRAQLELMVPRVAAARAALERDHPRLGAMAWSLGVIEVVGWALFLVVVRQELRAWRERREARDGTQA